MSTVSKRIVSIDVLRGFDMFWIIGGDLLCKALFTRINTPWALKLKEQLDHVTWHGFRFYDLVFPLFLFIVGISIFLSLRKRLKRGDSRKILYRHIIQRTVILFILGLMYNYFINFQFTNFRYTGVLQRIAICYFFASLICLHFRTRMLIIIAGSILLLYWIIMSFVPVPGYGAGNFSPEGNVASYVDRLYLPGRFCCFTYGDNEGILSTLPAIATTVLGVLTGKFLLSKFNQQRKVLLLLIAGIIFLSVSMLWDKVFPINKNLWTSSYVLHTTGWMLLLLGLFYWIIDVKGYQKWGFIFRIIGSNAITIYVLSGILTKGMRALFNIGGFISVFGNMKDIFFYSIVILVELLILYILYKKKIFIRV